MPEAKMKLTGGIVIPILIILVIVVGLRAAAILKGEVDISLMTALESEIQVADLAKKMHKVQQLKKAGGGPAKMSSMLSVARPSAPVVTSVRHTDSIFNFSTAKRDVIVEVKYMLDGVDKTEYFRFVYRPALKSWDSRGKSSKVSFYLNLI
jgi:hypothetical protein